MNNPSGRLFVCGDIHGCFKELHAALDAVGFDYQRDTLWALGDLVDRGPHSELVLALLDLPWFRSIKGNHEAMMEEAFVGNSEMHVCNGGGWFAALPEERRAELVGKVAGLPVAVTLESPSGRRIGLVHADVLAGDWDTFMSRLETPQVADMAMWSRSTIGHIKSGALPPPIGGVDHVYLGHTPLREPVRHANMSFIDTGCFATGVLTLEEVL